MSQKTFTIPTAIPTASSLPVPVPVPFPREVIDASHAGYNALWVVFAIMLISSAGFLALRLRTTIQKSLFINMTSLICVLATISYYAMATGLGSIIVANGPDSDRQVFFARYIDWAFTTPLLLMDLMFLAAMPVFEIVMVVLVDEIMILTGLFAALVPQSKYKWGFYAFSCLAYIYIVVQLAVTGRRNAFVRGAKVAKLFNGISLFVLVIWTMYPIAWAISEGRYLITVDQEITFYGILDVLAKPVFGAWLLYAYVDSMRRCLLSRHIKTPEANVVMGGVWTSGIGLPVEDETDS